MTLQELKDEILRERDMVNQQTPITTELNSYQKYLLDKGTLILALIEVAEAAKKAYPRMAALGLDEEEDFDNLMVLIDKLEVK